MKRFLVIGVFVILLLGLVVFKVVQKKTAEAQTKAQSAQRRNAPAVVALVTAGPKPIAQTVQAVGSLESPFTVKLSPNVSGRIDYLEVREGDPVSAGQILARIDPAEVEGQILQARSALAEAQQKVSQAKITQNSTAVGIYSTIYQQKAAVASSGADYNEVQVTYEAAVGAAHQAAVSAYGKVQSAQSNEQTSAANLRLAQANLEDSRAKYTREYSLYVQGFVAPQDLDDAKAAVKVNEAQVNAQQKMLQAAQSATRSAQADYQAAANQESIARKKGTSDIQDAKAKLTQSQATLASAVANKSQIPAYTENIRALTSEVDAARAALSQAVARRTYLIVKSSINGTVTQRLADPGAEASPGSPLLVIQYLKWLYVTSAIPVEFSSQIRPGLQVDIQLDSIPGRVFHSTITDINKSADPSSRQFMIRMKLDNSENILRPGMYAQLNMITSQVVAPVTVPLEAVATDNSGNSTATVVDSKMVAHVIPVTLGARDSSSVQITSGVQAGDRVVILTYRAVKDGSKVVEGSDSPGGSKGGGRGGHSHGVNSMGVAGGSPTGSSASTGAGGARSLSPLNLPSQSNSQTAPESNLSSPPNSTSSSSSPSNSGVGPAGTTSTRGQAAGNGNTNGAAISSGAGVGSRAGGAGSSPSISTSGSTSGAAPTPGTGSNIGRSGSVPMAPPATGVGRGGAVGTGAATSTGGAARGSAGSAVGGHGGTGSGGGH